MKTGIHPFVLLTLSNPSGLDDALVVKVDAVERQTDQPQNIP